MLKQTLIALTATGALILAGCQSAPPAKEAAAAPTITPEAKAALAKAEADVKAADSKHALWIPAQDSLKDAQAAAKKGDSATVLKESKEASDFASMGIQQKAYPLMSFTK